MSWILRAWVSGAALVVCASGVVAASDPVVDFLNHWQGASEDVLFYGVGLSGDDASELASIRAGEDGVCGTMDDHFFADLNEITSLSFLTSSDIAKIRAYAENKWNPQDEPPVYYRTVDFVNGLDATFKVLDEDAGLFSSSVEALVARRDGPDGIQGTADDDQFHTVREIDALPRVGTSSLNSLFGYSTTYRPHGSRDVYEANVDFGEPGEFPWSKGFDQSVEASEGRSEAGLINAAEKSDGRFEARSDKAGGQNKGRLGEMEFRGTFRLPKHLEKDTLRQEAGVYLSLAGVAHGEDVGIASPRRSTSWHSRAKFQRGEARPDMYVSLLTILWGADGVNRFQLKVRFDPSLFPSGDATTPQRSELTLRLGCEPLIVNTVIGDDEHWQSVENGKWSYRKESSPPFDVDSDFDGIADAKEDKNGDGKLDDGETDSKDEDTDGDSLLDGDELLALGTNPRNIDSDADLINDHEELIAGKDGFITDPLIPDFDGDGLMDGFETLYGLNPTLLDSDDDGVSDASEDPDGDGRLNSQEAATNTDPNNPDDDSDGAPALYYVSEAKIGVNGVDEVEFDVSIGVTGHFSWSPTSIATPNHIVILTDVGPVDEFFEVVVTGIKKTVLEGNTTSTVRVAMFLEGVNPSSKITVTDLGTRSDILPPFGGADISLLAKNLIVQLVKVGTPTIESGNDYSENTELQVKVKPSNISGLMARFIEKLGTTYYDGVDGTTALPMDVPLSTGIFNATANLIVKSVSNDVDVNGPDDASIIVEIMNNSGIVIGKSNELTVDQWFDADGDMIIDWLDVQVRDRLGNFQGLTNISGNVANVVTDVIQVFSLCGSTTVGHTTIGISPVCLVHDPANSHRLNKAPEKGLSATIIHEARHAWQSSMPDASLGTPGAPPDGDGFFRPDNDSDLDWLPEEVPFGSEAAQIRDDISGSGDNVFDDWGSVVEPARQIDAELFESHKNDI